MAAKPGRMRADELLLKLSLAPSRSVAQALILAGKVRSGPDAVVNKPSQSFPEDAVLTVDQPPRFVSRGGEKLEGALDHFKIPVEGLHGLDVGASTGGFTDALLRRGARRVQRTTPSAEGSPLATPSAKGSAGNAAARTILTNNAKLLQPIQLNGVVDPAIRPGMGVDLVLFNATDPVRQRVVQVVIPLTPENPMQLTVSGLASFVTASN